MSSPTRIRLLDLVKHYRTPAGVVRAVDGIDLEVEPGTGTAVTGPSGCGKSTLLGLIGGLEAPTRGSVRLGDREISALPERARAGVRRQQVGFLFQSGDLLPFLTAAENVALQLAVSGGDGDSTLARNLLAKVGLAEHADKLPDQLSGGQRQRVGIARALVHQPSLVLADEPTGELDTEASAAVIDLLLEAQRDLGATLVVVTHDLQLAGRLDRTVRLHDGRLVEDGRSSSTVESRR